MPRQVVRPDRPRGQQTTGAATSPAPAPSSVSPRATRWFSLAWGPSLSRDLWFSLLTDYDNISVYLPVGICDRCKTTTGEATYVDAIGTAEEWAKASVGLEVDQRQMTHELTRDYKRSQFVSSAIHSAERGSTATSAQSVVMPRRPSLAPRRSQRRFSDHTKRIDEMQRQLRCVRKGSRRRRQDLNNRQRMLTQSRKLVMGALQHDPGLAKYVDLQAPVFDSARCTACGEWDSAPASAPREPLTWTPTAWSPSRMPSA